MAKNTKTQVRGKNGQNNKILPVSVTLPKLHGFDVLPSFFLLREMQAPILFSSHIAVEGKQLASITGFVLSYISFP